jgi:hypothetical protein
LYYTLSFAQISALGLLCFTLAFLALRADRPVAAGFAIGSLVYKPSLLLVPAIVIAAAAMRRNGWRDRRIVAGAAAGVGAQLAAAAAFWGPSTLVLYVREQARLVPDMRDQFYVHHLHSWRSFFEILGLPEPLALALYAVVGSVVIAGTLRSWKSEAPLEVRYGVLLIATAIASPHNYVYDLVILTPAFLLLWDWSETPRRERVAPMFQWLLYFCYLAPGFAIVALVVRIQCSVPALTLLGCVASQRIHSERPPRTGHDSPARSDWIVV